MSCLLPPFFRKSVLKHIHVPKSKATTAIFARFAILKTTTLAIDEKGGLSILKH
jgi:hypothetical protein